MKYNPSEALEKARKILAKKEEQLELMKQLIRRLEMEAAWPELIGSEGIKLVGVEDDKWWLMDVESVLYAGKGRVKSDKELVRVSVALSPDSMLQEYSKHPKVDLKYTAKREAYRRRNIERRRKEENNATN